MHASSLPPPAKRRKTKGDKACLKKLELEVTAAAASNTSLNPLSDLVNLALEASDAKEMSKAIYSLYRVFVVIISNDKLAPGGGDPAKVVRKWIWERLDSYVELLVGLLQDEEAALRKSALDILFSLLRHLSTSLTKSSTPNQPQFHFSHFKHIAQGLLVCPPSPRPGSTAALEGKTAPDVREHFVDTWFTVHDDIRWAFLREAISVLSKHSPAEHPNVLGNLLSIMERLTTFPTEPSELNAWWVEELGKKPSKSRTSKTDGDYIQDEEMPDLDDEGEEDDWKKFFDEEPNAKDMKKAAGVKGRTHQLNFHQSLHSLQAHRAVFTRAWLNFLPHLSSVSTSANRTFTTRALNIMHRGVLPHLTRPMFVMDWISACVDFGGTVGLLALNALFILIKDYNLDYPLFYTRLYAFLDRDVLHLKHRARFFRLTEVFLSSTHLPSSLLASFVKRLSRLSLTAPPAAIVMIVPFTYNLLKRHPALMVMIHNAQDLNDSFVDPFLPDEVNPNVTNAIDSSLWELYSHRHHYESAVSTLARIFEEAFTKPGYPMEDFLDHTYGTLIEAELGRKIKREPALAMELVKNPFPPASNEVAEAPGLDAVSTLWVFG
ncbi:CBF-domain-containing protein [Gyrodon lividus]|nr:CBF-domain-containing protein [Gyrodon lividus]